MKSSTFSFTDPEGVKIFVFKWLPDGKVRAVVQISHGMAEHASRYERFAKALTAAGYAVYANDHRGHGKTAGGLENVGYPGDRDGFEWIVKDMAQLTGIIRGENPKVPVILFGHSMGSLLTQKYLADHPDKIKGAILMGSAGPLGPILYVGKVLAALQMFFQGKKHKSMLLNLMNFGPYNNHFKPNRTFFDWLSRDAKEVDKYIQDPYCGGIFSVTFFYELIQGTIEIHKMKNMTRIPKNSHLLFLSGEWCPVGVNTTTVKKLIEIYKKLGIKDVQYKIYKDARHELLHETNREEVMSDVIGWLDKNC